MKTETVASRAHRNGWRALRAAAAAFGLVVFTASGPQAGNHRGTRYEVVYLFDASNAVHLERARRLHTDIATLDAAVAYYGVVSDGESLEMARAAFEAGARSAGVESDLITASQAWSAGLGPRGLLRKGGDRLTLRDSGGNELTSGTGDQSGRILHYLRAAARSAGAAASTDVNFSTWGKVKDLFR